MRRLMRFSGLTAMLLLVLVATGCQRQQEPLYNGLPLKDWSERLASADPEVRVDALKAVTGIGEPARRLEPQLRGIARNDAYEDIRVQAVVALDSMHQSVNEFNALMAKYSQPIIPTDDEQEDQGIEIDTAMESIEEHASTDDDLNYLKETEESPDTPELDSGVMPADSLEQEVWRERRQNSVLDDLRQQLREPRVLANLLINGDLNERRFAARRLSEMAGENNEIREALESGITDADSLVRAAAKAAMEHWTRP